MEARERFSYPLLLHIERETYTRDGRVSLYESGVGKKEKGGMLVFHEIVGQVYFDDILPKSRKRKRS